MPTNEWFENNPKVSAYIPKDLHERLEGWMNSRGIKKVSQALTIILEETLGEQPASLSNDDMRSRLEAVEGKLTA